MRSFSWSTLPSPRIWVKVVRCTRSTAVNHRPVDAIGGEICSTSITFSINARDACRSVIDRLCSLFSDWAIERSLDHLVSGGEHATALDRPVVSPRCCLVSISSPSLRSRAMLCFWSRKWLLGMLVVIAFIIVDIVSTAVIVSKNHYDYGPMTDYHSNSTNGSHGYMEDVYIKPWCRVAPYAVGLALGHCLYELFQRSNTVSWESILPQRTPQRYQRLRKVLAWTFALIVLSLCVFGTYGDYADRPLTRSGRVTFLTLSRLGWSIGLGALIITCFVGHGGECPSIHSASLIRLSLGLANKILSHSIFDALAQLTYGAYLWHALVVLVSYLGREQPTHYTIGNLVRIGEERATPMPLICFSSSCSIASCTSSFPTHCPSSLSFWSNYPSFNYWK